MTREEVLDYIEKCRAEDVRVNLTGVNLTGVNLEGADLYRADLTGVNLRGADLKGADLRWADLRGADLEGADLGGADLDFSCWPLWCGSLGVTVDKRLFDQLCYHLCSLKVKGRKTIQNQLKRYANKSHLVDKELVGVIE